MQRAVVSEHARRGTQRPVEGGSVAEREAKAAKESMSATGNGTGGDEELNTNERRRRRSKTSAGKRNRRKREVGRMVPKLRVEIGYAVFGYHEHIVQEALRAHLIAVAPSLGIDVLMAARMKNTEDTNRLCHC